MKRRMDYLGKKGKRKNRPLTEEYVQFCEAEHKVILEKYGVGEALSKSLVSSWESSDQQNNVLIRNSMGDKNLNIF